MGETLKSLKVNKLGKYLDPHSSSKQGKKDGKIRE